MKSGLLRGFLQLPGPPRISSHGCEAACAVKGEGTTQADVVGGGAEDEGSDEGRGRRSWAWMVRERLSSLVEKQDVEGEDAGQQ